MRKIKFRALVTERGTKETHIFYDFLMWLDSKGNVERIASDTFKYKNDIYDIELEQFTGLKDKNGKEIYEGDIVESIGNEFIPTQKNEVVFENGAFITNGVVQNLHYFKNNEVIGNKHKNQEKI